MTREEVWRQRKPIRDKREPWEREIGIRISTAILNHISIFSSGPLLNYFIFSILLYFPFSSNSLSIRLLLSLFFHFGPTLFYTGNGPDIMRYLLSVVHAPIFLVKCIYENLLPTNSANKYLLSTANLAYKIRIFFVSRSLMPI